MRSSLRSALLDEVYEVYVNITEYPKARTRKSCEAVFSSLLHSVIYARMCTAIYHLHASRLIGTYVKHKDIKAIPSGRCGVQGSFMILFHSMAGCTSRRGVWARCSSCVGFSQEC